MFLSGQNISGESPMRGTSRASLHQTPPVLNNSNTKTCMELVTNSKVESRAVLSTNYVDIMSIRCIDMCDRLLSKADGKNAVLCTVSAGKIRIRIPIN